MYANLTFEWQSIFAMNACCLQLDQALVYEAARMAQSLRYHKSSNAQPVHLRVFWTIYHLEKIASFSDNNSSVSLAPRLFLELGKSFSNDHLGFS
jgi:hypothetical protein